MKTIFADKIDRSLFLFSGALFLGSIYFMFDDSALVNLGVDARNLLPVGQVTESINDVRRRLGTDVAWFPLGKKDGVFDGDSLFTGFDSEATFTLTSGDQFRLSPGSLVVVRSDNGRPQINIESGSLTGEVKSSESISVRVQGEEIKLQSAQPGKKPFKIQLRTQKNSKTQISVLQGEAKVEVGGEEKTLKVNQTARLLKAETPGQKAILEPPLAPAVEMISPPDQSKILTGSDSPVQLKWKQKDLEQEFEVEVSKDESFLRPVVKKSVKGGQLEVASDNLSGRYFWRVSPKGARDQASVRAFTATRLEPPTPTLPRNDAVLALESGLSDKKKVARGVEKAGSLKVRMEWKDWMGSPGFKVELSRDPDFSQPVAQLESSKASVEFPDIKSGQYYWRVKGHGEALGSLPWSRTSAFKVVETEPEQFQALQSEGFDPESLQSINQIARQGRGPATELPTDQHQAVEPTDDKKLALKIEPQKAAPPAPAIKKIPELLGPEDNDYFGVRDGKNEIPLAWSNVPDAQNYLVEVSKTPDYQKIFKSKSLKGLRLTLKGIPEGQYHWRVTPTLKPGKVGTSSKSSSFNVVPDAKLPPPKLKNKTQRIEVRFEGPPKTHNAFSLWSIFMSTAEAQGTPRKSIPLQWNQVPNANRYRLQISMDNAFSKVVLDTDVSGLEFKWFDLKPGQFFWRVCGLTEGNREGEWSETASIEVAIAAPKIGAPKVIQQKVTQKKDLEKPPKPVMLNWSPNTAAKYYELRVSPSKDLKNAKSYLTNTNTTEVPVPAPGEYFYQVRALDDTKKPISKFSETAAFQLKTELALPPPPAPDLKPKDVEVAFSKKNNAVKFNWPPVEGANSYRIEISKDPDFETQLNSQDVRTNAYEFKDLPEGKIHWRVRSQDDKDEMVSDWSQGEFNLKEVPPVLTPPALRGAMSRISIATDDAVIPSFQWDPVQGAVAYKVEVSDSPDFKRIVSTSYTKQSFARIPLQNSKDYYWRVSSVDALPEDSDQILSKQIQSGEPSRAGSIRIQPGETFSVGINLGMGSTAYSQTSGSTQAPNTSGNSSMSMAFGVQSDYWFKNDTGLRFDFSSLSRSISLRNKTFEMNQLDAGLRGQIRFPMGGAWSFVIGAGLAYRPIQAVVEKTAGDPTLQEARGIAWNQQLDLINQSASAKSLYRVGLGSMQSLTNVFGGFVLRPSAEARFRFGSFWAGVEAYYIQDPIQSLLKSLSLADLGSADLLQKDTGFWLKFGYWY